MYNLLLVFAAFVQTSIYGFSFRNTDGNNVPLSSFQGKKILLVNIATGSSRVNQLADLQSLKSQMGDSLVVIAFPSNSFGHESRSNSEIKQFCADNYHIDFIIAEKSEVTGDNINSIYSWLSRIEDNEIMSGKVVGDFQKFLIDEEGSILGVFAPDINPGDSRIKNAIRHNY